MNILEGEQSNIIQPFRKREPVQLDFFVKLNKFILETYPNGMPKEYISNVTIIDGNFTKTAIIKVNQPIKYKDVVFYQASYNIIPEFKIVVNLNGKKEEHILSPFHPLSISDKYSIALSDYGEAHGFIYLKVWILNEETNETKEGMIISGFPASEFLFDKDNLALEYK
ncbi:MAG: cytochrome c biogenesis protein ResB, partial [Caldimicrobium sp.]